MANNTNIPITVTTQSDVKGLRDLQKASNDARDAFIALSKSGTASAEDIKNAGQKYSQAKGELDNMKSALKDVAGNTKMSSAQLLEFGENLTVIAAGIEHAISKIIEFTKRVYEMAIAGSEEENMRKHFDEVSGSVENAKINFELLQKASSGLFTEREILSYNNQMTDLNFTVEQSAKFLDIATTKHHELGISVSEANNRLVRFLETGNKRGLFTLGMDISDINKKIFEMSGLTEKQVKALDSEQQIRLRSDAVLQLYGRSIDDINNKQKTTADILKNVGVVFDNAKDKIGAFVSGVLAKIVTALGLTNEKIATFIIILGGAVTAVLAITAAVIGLTIAFSALDIVSGGILIAVGVLVLQVAALSAVIITNWEAIKNWYNEQVNLQVAIRNLEKAWDNLTSKFDGFSFDKIINAIGTLFTNALNIAVNAIIIMVRGLQLLIDTFNWLYDKIHLGWQILSRFTQLLANAIPQTWINSIKDAINWVIDKVDKAYKGLKYLMDLLGITTKVDQSNWATQSTNNIAKSGIIPDKVPPGGKKEKADKEDNPEQIEAKTLDAIINKYKDKIKLLDLDKSGNAEIRFERQKALEDAEKELELNYLSLQYDKNKVKNLDEQDRISKEINKTFGHSVQAKKQETEPFVFGDSKAKKLSPADKDLKAQEPVYDYKKANEKVQAIMDVATQTVNILGLGADSFIGKMISGFQQVIGLADSVVSMLAKLGAIGGNAASGGIFGLVGSLFGFAEGGFTGNLPTNAVAGVVHGGEYVIKASAVTPQTIPLLQAINGANPYSQIAKYASGGYVNRSVNNNIYLAGTLDGQKFHQVNEKKFRMIQNATMMKG
ncbi:MAG: hypothetical protein PHN88_02840 [Ignavibacteria bacterium]|nr:hypothetical protein [Ignavibacteria bacterium]